jgi:adenylate cyclase
VRIRAKIVFIVLPLLLSSLVLSTAFSSLSARSGLTRIAMQFLGFKSRELKNYIDNQWNLLVSNNLSANPEYVEITKQAVQSYSGTLIRSGTELIFAVDEEAVITMSTRSIELDQKDRYQLLNIINNKQEGWVEFALLDKERVGHMFYYPIFNWYVFVSEEREAFYREVTEITMQSGIILASSLVVTFILLFAFAGYLTRPLLRVERTMKDIIVNNDLSERVDVEFKDEIGNLAHTFNIMIGELERAYKQIKGFALKAVIAQKNEHKIRNIFQKYVPKDVIENFFQNPEGMLVGENRVLAILFSDIRSFTTISEGFMPDELVEALNRYFEIMVEIIMRRGGVIDKYIGDAIMAFFGAPVKHKDDALQSLYAALEMQEALTEFNEEQQKMGKPAFLTGIGINYGVVTVGNIGSEKKMDYTIIGDMVNLGSRLEGLTKPYKQSVIFSESVYQKVKGELPCRLVDKVVVKGKTQGEKIFTAKQELTANEKTAWATYHKALKLYYKQDFSNAIKLFHRCKQSLTDDHLSLMYIERCKQYLESPPPADWSGIEILKSK